MARFEKDKSLSSGLTKYLSIDYPIFIPPGERLNVTLHLPLRVHLERRADATKEQNAAFNEQLGKYLNEKFPNFDGFVLYDHQNRYQINLPKGW